MTVHKPDNLYFKKDTITITDIFLMLVRSWKIILITPTILCILTIINVQFIEKPVYVSSAKIMSSSGGGSSSQMMGLASQLGINLQTAQSEPNWINKDIIQRRVLARSMLTR